MADRRIWRMFMDIDQKSKEFVRKKLIFNQKQVFSTSIRYFLLAKVSYIAKHTADGGSADLADIF
jgi:hypothetical protein